MTISEKKKLILVEWVDYTCEECKKKFKVEELEIHRINSELGYHFRNCKVCCSKCHEYYSSAQRMVNGIQR